MREHLLTLKAGVNTYQPNKETRQKIITKQAEFVALAGPVGVGKTTIGDRVVELDTSIGLLNTVTTRQRKGSDPEGFKTAKEGITIASLTASIERGEVLNYDVIVDTEAIYAFNPESFQSKYNIAPMTATNIDTYRQLGLERFSAVFFISPVAMWASYLQKSLGDRNDSIAKRMPEAIDSLSYAKQHLDDLIFVESRDDGSVNGIDTAARTVIQVVHDEQHPVIQPDRALHIIDTMIDYAKSIAR
jgi:guanylate kinase